MTSSNIWSLAAIAMAIVAMTLAHIAARRAEKASASAREAMAKLCEAMSLALRSSELCSEAYRLASLSNELVLTDGCGPISDGRSDCSCIEESVSANCLISGDGLYESNQEGMGGRVSKAKTSNASFSRGPSGPSAGSDSCTSVAATEDK